MKKNTKIEDLKTKKSNKTSKIDKKPIKLKKSYIITNGLEYKGKFYKKGKIIDLFKEELKLFPKNSLLEVVLGIKGTL